LFWSRGGGKVLNEASPKLVRGRTTIATEGKGGIENKRGRKMAGEKGGMCILQKLKP